MNLDYGEEHGELRLIIYSPLGRDVRPGSGAVMMMPILRQDEVYRLQASIQSCILSPVSLIQGWVGNVRILRYFWVCEKDRHPGESRGPVTFHIA